MDPLNGPGQRPDLDAQLTAINPDDPEFRARSAAWRAEHEADMRRTGRIPTLNDYRKVYANLEARHGLTQPSDDEICERHLVAP